MVFGREFKILRCGIWYPSFFTIAKIKIVQGAREAYVQNRLKITATNRSSTSDPRRQMVWLWFTRVVGDSDRAGHLSRILLVSVQRIVGSAYSLNCYLYKGFNKLVFIRCTIRALWNHSSNRECVRWMFVKYCNNILYTIVWVKLLSWVEVSVVIHYFKDKLVHCLSMCLIRWDLRAFQQWTISRTT